MTLDDMTLHPQRRRPSRICMQRILWAKAHNRDMSSQYATTHTPTQHTLTNQHTRAKNAHARAQDCHDVLAVGQGNHASSQFASTHTRKQLTLTEQDTHANNTHSRAQDCHDALSVGEGDNCQLAICVQVPARRARSSGCITTPYLRSVHDSRLAHHPSFWGG